MEVRMDVENPTKSNLSVSAFLSSITGLSPSKKMTALSVKLQSKNALELIPCLIMLKQCVQDRVGTREFVSADMACQLVTLCHNFFNQDEDVMLHGLAILCRVANGSSTDKDYLKKQGALEVFRSGLEHKSDLVRQQACNALSHFCNESLSLRNEILELEVVPWLIEMSQRSSKIGCLRSALSLMNALCRGPVYPDPAITIGLFPLMVAFLVHIDEELQISAISGIASISRFSCDLEEMRSKIPYLVPQIVSMLEGSHTPNKTLSILDSLLSICSNSEVGLASAIQNNLIVLLDQYSDYEKLAVRNRAKKLTDLLSNRDCHRS